MQPGAGSYDRNTRLRAYDDVIVLSTPPDGQARGLAWARRAQDEVSTARPKLPHASHLSYCVDLNGDIRSPSEYTAVALEHRMLDMVGCNATALLRPGETEIDPALHELFMEAKANPGKHYTTDKGYMITGETKHRIDCVKTVVYFNPLIQQWVIDCEMTEEEIRRIRGRFPQQFIDPVERMAFSEYIEARNRREMQTLRDDLDEMKAQLVQREAKTSKLRKWEDQAFLRCCLHQVHADVGDEWDVLTQDQYCQRLEELTGEHIVPNTLAKRFKDNGWLKNGSLREALREMGYEDSADLRLF